MRELRKKRMLIKDYPFETCLGIVSTMGILQYDNMSFFLLFSVFFIIVKAARDRKWFFNIDPIIWMIFIGLTVTTAISIGQWIGDSWVKRSIKGYLTITLIIIILILFNSESRSHNAIAGYIYGIQISCFINVLWAILQFVCYRAVKADINTILFVNILHTVSVGSTFRGNTVSCSGLHWHPGNLAPLLVIGFFFTNKRWYKAVIVIIGVLTFHATTIIGVAACLASDLLRLLIQKRSVGRKRIIRFIIEGTVLLSGIAILVLRFNIVSIISPILTNFHRKIAFQGTDNSSMVHLSYYQMLPQVLGLMESLQFIFGIGYGCSGFMYSKLTGQYAELSTWAVESDYVNNLIGLGIINSFLIIMWFVKTAWNGIKLDLKYFLIIIIIMFEGFGYNVQFDWLILFIGILSISIKKKYNVFSDNADSILRTQRIIGITPVK